VKRTIVTLCGSTKFLKEYMECQASETLKGNIVLTCGCFRHTIGQSTMFADGYPGYVNAVVMIEQLQDSLYTPEQKAEADALHMDKIDMSHEILVINVGGYIGESTQREINYAREKGKLIRFLEPTLDPHPHVRCGHIKE